MKAWNKGLKMPHTQEWEANRLAAIRRAASLRDYPSGYHRPKEHTEPMRKALQEWRSKNPHKAKQLAIGNLPKDISGDRNGNWKGGVTAKTRGLRFSKDYVAWRKSVLDRDGNKCRACGSTNRLHVHHLISMRECELIATLRMNGVTLCKDCHLQNDKVWQGDRPQRMEFSGKSLALIFTIPHKFQEYETCGNWQFAKDGTIVIFISAMDDWRAEALVAVHELVEVLLCKQNGVSQSDVDRFDKDFEANREEGNADEPGDAPDAPYRDEHCLATSVERMMCSSLGLAWADYEDMMP